MGYALCIGHCIRCSKVFGFNPRWVPSTSAVTGQREPLCRDCYDQLQATRKKLGVEPWPQPHPEAYEAIDEEEL